jgi:hypothetical protein
MSETMQFTEVNSTVPSNIYLSSRKGPRIVRIRSLQYLIFGLLDPIPEVPGTGTGMVRYILNNSVPEPNLDK